jgi:hypothetical protein
MSVREEGERKSERERERERERRKKKANGARRPLQTFYIHEIGCLEKSPRKGFYSCGKKCFLGQFSILIWRKLQASATLNLLLY